MTPLAVAVIGLRIVGLWILVQALFSLGAFGFMMLHEHGAAHAANPIIAPSFDRLHEASLTHAPLWLTVPLILMRFIGGLAVLFLSKPVGALVARRVE
jgi:hypothetical protein